MTAAVHPACYPAPGRGASHRRSSSAGSFPAGEEGSLSRQGSGTGSRVISPRQRRLTRDRAGSMTTSVRRAAASVVSDVLTLNDPSKHADPDHPISAVSITFNLVQSTCGVGILSLATTFAYGGVVVAAVLFCLVATLTYHSIKLLLDALLRTGKQSYETLGEHCLGAPGRRAVQFCVLGICLTGLAAYLVSLKAFIWLVFKQVIPSDAWKHFTDNGGSKDTLLLACVILLILPLSLTRNIDALARTSLIGIFCIVYFVVLSVYYMGHYAQDGIGGLHCHEIDDPSKDRPTDDVKLFNNGVFEILSAFAIVGASFACQFTVFPVYREARIPETERQAAKKIARSSAAAMLIVTPLYLLAAFAGYYVWRQVAPKASSVLACYDTAVPAVAVAYVGMSITMICAFPLVCFSARYTLATIVLGDSDEEISTARHAAMTIGVVGSVTVVASVTDSLGTVLSIGSALSTPGSCFILPALCFLKARRMAAEIAASDEFKGDKGGGAMHCNQESQGSSEDLLRGNADHDEEDGWNGGWLIRADFDPGAPEEGSGGPSWCSPELGGQLMLAFGCVLQVGMLVGSILNLVL
eukprot:TRINITY_DN61309_c0_g1_i1.p1 TRINITY_DN61309_c0_g1~~TRINITY_DN61309_c0_g1_i1.p1  ORF type:complete len:582 (+),score=150.74 TRINITY_DN61309_c0_g1_i1:94-1839(+)